MPKPIHQRVTIGQPVPFVACGVKINRVQSSALCRLVTCPKCLAFQKSIVDAVFAPLKP